MELDMKAGKKQENGIKVRLLKSACEVFAEKGYRDATVAEICERAGANIAAVNYYFGSKDAIYVEAWRLSFQRSLEKYPADGGIPSSASAEQRLQGRISSIIRRFSDPQSHEFDIMHKELANPTGLLSEVKHKTIEPLRQGLVSIIRELLGEKATEQQVLLCQMSIRAQCFDRLIRERLRKALIQEGAKTALLAENIDIDTIVDHVTRFSLAGIREMGRQIESGEVAEKHVGVITMPVSGNRASGEVKLTGSSTGEKSID
jgi:AcrR family transcriptional regulator